MVRRGVVGRQAHLAGCFHDMWRVGLHGVVVEARTTWKNLDGGRRRGVFQRVPVDTEDMITLAEVLHENLPVARDLQILGRNNLEIAHPERRCPRLQVGQIAGQRRCVLV